MYEINVSYKGRGHLFATAERSCRSRHDLLDVLHVITKKFPESEGFTVTVTETLKEESTLNVCDLLEEGRI